MKIIMLILYLAYSSNSEANQSFHIQYKGTLSCDGESVVYLDMRNYSAADVRKCKKKDSIVMAYVSSQYESWRDDAKLFTKKDKGKDLDDWQGEKWVNTKSKNVRKIMVARIAKAKAMGFNGMDFDNTDFYHFKTGFDNSKKAAIEYTQFLIDETHRQGMFYSLKNTMDLIKNLKRVDYYQNESCHKYRECGSYSSAKVPIFIIEYKRCPSRRKRYKKAYTIRKKGSMTPKARICR